MTKKMIFVPRNPAPKLYVGFSMVMKLLTDAYAQKQIASDDMTRALQELNSWDDAMRERDALRERFRKIKSVAKQQLGIEINGLDNIEGE